MVPFIPSPVRRSPLVRATNTPLTAANTTTNTTHATLRRRRVFGVGVDPCSSSAISRAARAV